MSYTVASLPTCIPLFFLHSPVLNMLCVQRNSVRIYFPLKDLTLYGLLSPPLRGRWGGAEGQREKKNLE